MISPSGSSRDRGAVWIPAGVFLAALALRLIGLLQLHACGLWDYLRLDPLYYHDWAVHISEGNLLGTDTFEMSPLYAYLLGAIFKISGHGLWLPRLVQAVIGAWTCALIALLGVKAFGRAEGLAGGLLMAAYGPDIFHGMQITKTILTTGLSTATAAALYFSEGRKPLRVLLGGLLLGITALCQENIMVTVPILTAWVLLRAPSGRRLLCGASLVCGFAAAVAPATLRNYAVSHELVLITSGGGEVFYTGNNEFASGKYRVPAFVRPDPIFEHEDFRAEATRRLGRPLTRRESDAFWWHEGLRFIAGNPARYAALLWDKLATYLNDFERPDNYSYQNFSRFVPLLGLPLVRFGWILPLAAVGLLASASRFWEMLPLHTTMGAYLLSALLFFTQSRYRMPMVPLLILFSGHGFVLLVTAVRQHAWRLLAWALPVLLGLAIFSNRDPGNGPAFEAQRHGILGEMLLYAGRPEEAASEFRTALARLAVLPPDASGDQTLRVTASSHYGLALAIEQGSARGPEQDRQIEESLAVAARSPDADLRRDALEWQARLRLERADPVGAVEALEAAVSAAPNDFPLRLMLGEALHKAGRPAEALETVSTALSRIPETDPVMLADAHYGLALIYLGDLPDAALAKKHLREVLALNPAHPRTAWIREQLSKLEASGP